MLDNVINAIDSVQDPGEKALVLHARADRPIRGMTFLQRSLLFAELSMIAYNDEDETHRAAAIVGFPDVTFYDRDGSQAYRFRNDDDCVIACRGTEPNQWNDLRADVNVAGVLAETAGKVHRGFKQEVDDLWPMLETALITNDQPLWFCGHSLGGAMAMICAARCFLSHISSIPEQVYTFGSPRVGDNQYVSFVKLEHFRYVNNNDIVTRVPPVWLGYQHAGSEVYLNRDGEIHKLGVIGKRRDRWKGFWRGLKRWKVDHFDDHSIHHYIQAILRAAKREQDQINRGGLATQARQFNNDTPDEKARTAANPPIGNSQMSLHG